MRILPAVLRKRAINDDPRSLTDRISNILSKLTETGHVEERNLVLAIILFLVPGHAKVGDGQSALRKAQFWIAGHVAHNSYSVIKSHVGTSW